MSVTRQVHRLEPVRRFLALVVLGHLLLAAIVWWWVQVQRFSKPRVIESGNVSWMEPSEVTSTIPRELILKDSPPEKAPTSLGFVPSTAAPTTGGLSSPVSSPTSLAAQPPIVIKSQQPPPKVEPEEKPVPKAILIRPPDKPASTTPSPTPAPPAPSSPPSAAAQADTARFVTISRPPDQKAGSTAGLDAVDRALIDGFLKLWTPPRGSGVSADQRSVHLDASIDRAGRLVSFKVARPSGDNAVDTSVLEAADRLDKIGESLPDSYSGDRYSVQVHFHVE